MSKSLPLFSVVIPTYNCLSFLRRAIQSVIDQTDQNFEILGQTRVALDAARLRLNMAGHDVTEIDHDWCTSIYANDPNDILVEFCTTTKPFAEGDKERAQNAVTSDDLEDNVPPQVTMHSAL